MNVSISIGFSGDGLSVASNGLPIINKSGKSSERRAYICGSIRPSRRI
jgi:hypothetical protein